MEIATIISPYDLFKFKLDLYLLEFSVFKKAATRPKNKLELLTLFYEIII